MTAESIDTICETAIFISLIIVAAYVEVNYLKRGK